MEVNLPDPTYIHPTFRSDVSARKERRIHPRFKLPGIAAFHLVGSAIGVLEGARGPPGHVEGSWAGALNDALSVVSVKDGVQDYLHRQFHRIVRPTPVLPG